MAVLNIAHDAKHLMQKTKFHIRLLKNCVNRIFYKKASLLPELDLPKLFFRPSFISFEREIGRSGDLLALKPETLCILNIFIHVRNIFIVKQAIYCAS